MVRLTIALHAASQGAAQDLLDALSFVVVSTRFEPGCATSAAWSDTNSVRYVEEWKTEEEMRRRIRSDAFTSVLSIVESATDPTVQFDFVTRTRGLDYVAEVRNDAVS